MVITENTLNIQSGFKPLSIACIYLLTTHLLVLLSTASEQMFDML